MYWIATFVVVILCILYCRMPGSSGFTLDDGYISLHNAQVLHWGKDPNFANVPPLAGATNAPYVMLLYLLLFALPPLVALQTASWLGVLCYSLGMIAMGKAFRLSSLATAAVACIGLAAGKVPYHLLNGLETGMAMGLMAWIFALVKNNTVWSRRGAALLCGLAPFLRPELVALSALVLVAIFLHDFFQQDHRGWEQFSQTVRRFMPLLLLAGVAAIPWMLWYGLSTQALIAQSIEAKRLFFAEGCHPAGYRWFVTITSIRFFVAVVGFLVFSLVFLVRQNLGRCVLLFVPVFVLAYYERFPGALIYNWGRYTYILVPILIFGLISGLGDRSVWVRRAAYGLLGLACLQTAISFPEHWKLVLRDRDTFTQSVRSVADWTNSHLPPDATVLVHDVGYISYATKFHLVDFVGLKTPSSIEYHRSVTWGTCGAGRVVAVSEIARRANPQYLILMDDWDGNFKISAGLRELGWGLDEMAALPLYRVFRLTPPTGTQSTARAEQGWRFF